MAMCEPRSVFLDHIPTLYQADHKITHLSHLSDNRFLKLGQVDLPKLESMCAGTERIAPQSAAFLQFDIRSSEAKSMQDILLTIERSASGFESFSLPDDGQATAFL